MWTMTTYPILDNTGTPFAFEIENVYLTLSRVTTLLRSIDGVSDIQQRRLFRGPMDVHVRFRYRGVPFVVWEPYGDSSRYWIGPSDEQQAHPDIAALQATFNGYEPPLLVKALGYLVSLKFLVPARQK